MTSRYKLHFFFFFLLVIVLAVTGYNFYRYYIAKEYSLHVFIACNPMVHNCFVADPATADPTFQANPYAKVQINAKYAPSCLEEHSCVNFSCKGVLGFCQLIYCSRESLEDGETCSSS